MLTREQVRSLDRIAMERFGIPGIALMENAGRGAAEMLVRRLSPHPESPISIVAGKGNNGGDGFVIARHLANQGFRPRIAILGERRAFRGPGDAGVNFEIVERLGLSIEETADGASLLAFLDGAELIVDSVLGTGLAGEVRGTPRAAIEAMNASGAPVFAVDIPSGLDCDTGRPLGLAVQAVATATFAAMKVGLREAASERYTGPVEVIDIGTPVVWE